MNQLAVLADRLQRQAFQEVLAGEYDFKRLKEVTAWTLALIVEKKC